MSLLLHTIHASGAVASSSIARCGRQLVVATSAAIKLFELRDGAPTLVHELRPPTQLLHVVALDSQKTGAPDALLAIAAGGHGRHTIALLLAVAEETGQLSVLDKAPLVAEGMPHIDLAHPTFSALHSSGGRLVLCCAIAEGCAHVVWVHKRARGLRLSVGCNPLFALLGAEDGASVLVQSVALAPSSKIGNFLLAALVMAVYPLGGGPATHTVACLSMGTDGCFTIGPWVIRNIHPTTIVHPCLLGANGENGSDMPSAMLLVSSRGAQVVEVDGPSRLAIPAQFGGAPTAAASLGGGSGLVAVATRDAELHVLDTLRGTCTRATASASLPIASCLTFVPGWADAAAGALFVGSASGSSVLVEVPAGDPANSTWDVLPDALVSSLAPVRDAILVPDPGGCGDARLVCCCGHAPRGRLAVAWLAAALERPLADGPHIPAQVRLIPLHPTPSTRHHSHLLLSFEGVAASTLALAATGSSIAKAPLPGLLDGCATLLAAALPGGRLLQVTPQLARVARTDDGRQVAAWQRGPISLAALHGHSLALASGCEVWCLRVITATGQLEEERCLRMRQQVSALSLFELPSCSPCSPHQGFDDVWLAVGLWVVNEVVIQQLTAKEPAATLSLGGHQPRSLLVARLGTALRLFVGTATGELLWWELRGEVWQGGAAITTVPGSWVRVGVAAVELQLLPAALGSTAGEASFREPSSSRRGISSGGPGDGKPLLLARSDQSVLLQADEVDPGGLQVVRVHGGQGLAAACAFQADELPPNSLAWVARDGQLLFGQLNPTPRVCWVDIPLGAAPSSAAYHAASGCVATACIDSRGSGSMSDTTSSLRLVDLAASPSAALVGCVALSPGHVITAVAVLRLACSTAASSSSEVDVKEFLVAASCMEGTAERRKDEPPSNVARAADSSCDEPWWRQAAVFQEQPPAAAPHAQQQRHQQHAQRDDGVDHDGGELGAPASQECSDESRSRAWLSFFEVVRELNRDGRSSARSDGSISSDLPFQLALQGTVPLSSACFSLAAVEPSAEPLEQSPSEQHPSEVAEEAADGCSRDRTHELQQHYPLLLAGCEDGLHLYRCFVDAAGREAGWAVDQGLQAISVVEPLELCSRSEASTEDVATPPGTILARCTQEGLPHVSHAANAAAELLDAAGRRLWHQRVAMQLLARMPTHDEGVIAQLAVCGHAVFAADLGAGVSAFEVRPPAPGFHPTLVPCSTDADSGAGLPLLPLSETHVVTGMQPHGLTLLQRNLREERRQRALGLERARREFEAGVASGGTFASRPLFVPSMQAAGKLEPSACCEQLGQSSISALAVGVLGVPVRPLPELLASVVCRGAAAATEADHNHLGQAAVFVSAAGEVGSLQTLERGQLAQLLRLQQALELSDSERGAEPGLHHHSASSSDAVSSPTLPCINLETLAPCMQPDHALTAEAQRRGVPMQLMVEARQLLLELRPGSAHSTIASTPAGSCAVL